MLFAFLLLSCLVGSEPAIDPPPTVAIRRTQVRPRDPYSQGLARRPARGRRPDIRRDHSAAGLRPSRYRGLRARSAPETLDDYRTRIDTSAKKNGRKSGKLASNVVKKDARGERLETIWEFHPDAGGFWHEVSVRIDRQSTALHFCLERRRLESTQKTRPAFDAVVSAASVLGPKHRR